MIDRQSYISETFGIPEPSLSELLSQLETEGAILRRHDGRREVISVAGRALVAAE